MLITYDPSLVRTQLGAHAPDSEIRHSLQVTCALACSMWLCADGCPEGFTRVDDVDGCYKMLTDKMSWSAAGLMCKAYNKHARLLVIDSQRKQTAIRSWILPNSCKYTFYSTSRQQSQTAKPFRWITNYDESNREM